MPQPGKRPLYRFLLLVALVVAGIVAVRFTPLRDHLEPERLAALLEEMRQLPASPLLFALLTLVLATLGVPASPMLFAGGAVYGFLLGATLSFAGLYGAAVLSYWLGRSLAHDFVMQLLGKRTAIIEPLLERHGFWTIVRLRLVPIPFAIINYGASLAGVKPGVYLAATALGLAPANFVFTYFAASLVTAAEGARYDALRNVGLAFLLMLAMTFLPRLFRRRETS